MPIDFSRWDAFHHYDGEPKAVDWLVQGLVPRGCAGTLSAEGGGGKSMLGLDFCLKTGCWPEITKSVGPENRPLWFGSPVVARGATVFITAEDDRDELHRRLNQLDPGKLRKRAKGRFYFIALPNEPSSAQALMYEDHKTGRLVETPAWALLKAQLNAIPDLALVVIDPLACFFFGNMNDQGLAYKFMQTMNQFAATKNCTMMFLHHFTKAREISSLKEARNAIRGSAALVDGGRFAMVLWEEERNKAKAQLKDFGRDYKPETRLSRWPCQSERQWCRQRGAADDPRRNVGASGRPE